VKGRSEATRIFALLGDSALKQSQAFIDLTARHNEFLNRYRAKDWNSAASLARDCAQMNMNGLDRLYALYSERIDFFRQNPPPLDWDGTAEALDK
jgi:adenylate cyclase